MKLPSVKKIAAIAAGGTTTAPRLWNVVRLTAAMTATITAGPI